MKIRSVLIIVITLFSCKTQSTVIKKWFPINSDFIINHGIIYEYMYNFRTDDINIARNAYLNVLAFIKEVIDAGHENLARAERMEILTVKRPTLVDGVLTIIESTEMTTPANMWSEVQKEFVEVTLINILWEFALIINYSMQYNYLLDHWHSLTSELLSERIDVIILHDELRQEIQPLLEPKTF